ncbi:MAG: hypothetical protein JJE12_10715 [Anaerolineales bacterium]|nr:hypothetical protein [Anaerolineales bacterium]
MGHRLKPQPSESWQKFPPELPRGTINSDPVVWAAIPALSRETNRNIAVGMSGPGIMVKTGGTAGFSSRPCDGRDVFC